MRTPSPELQTQTFSAASRHLCRITLLVFLSLIAAADRSAAAEEGRVDFDTDIRPILSENCFQCHGPDEKVRQAGLRLDLREGLFRERDGVTVVVPGKPDESELIRRITSEDEFERMPPPDADRELTAEQIELLTQWVQQGATWKQHWSFVPPQRPELPVVRPHSSWKAADGIGGFTSVWPQNPIDRFVLARLGQEKLTPSPEATKERLIRRVTLDLTGLPPTPAEVDAFLADDSPDAYEKLVDRLLASPRYGERMAWNWLEAARYADSNGYQGDPERTMWPWRDWVIRALNENMPFDRFTIEQLAGDLLPLPHSPPSEEGATGGLSQLIATGFNRNHMHNGEGGRIPEETRVENVMDRTETTATVWLGLTMTCARCHDHKYDPITQKEYYRLYAFFNNLSADGGGRSGQIPPVVTYLTDENKTRRAELNRQVNTAAETVAALEADLMTHNDGSSTEGAPESARIPEELRKSLSRPPVKRGNKTLDQLITHFSDSRPEYVQRLKELKQAVVERQKFNRQLPRVMVMDDKQRRQTRVLVKGTYNKPTGDSLSPGTPAIFPPLPEDGPQNRLALARWLVDPENPLTARVTVNRYWQTFFGTGLVKTPEDFGVQGERPSHPKLLDWLAVEFIDSGWDVKHMHRLIVTSATYRQSSKIDPSLIERDPDNRLLARGPRSRLPSWMLRDQALAASGLLVEKIGGPPVKPYQPEGIWAEATFGKKKYVQDHGDKLYRRSVNTFWRRIIGPPMFFDTAKRQTCTVKQTRTNTPLHALTLMNDVTYVETARALAERVLTARKQPKAHGPKAYGRRSVGEIERSRIGQAFRRATARLPDAEELELLQARLQKLKSQFAEDREAALQLLQVGESPRNENLDPVEHAAYTALCTLILNLDETLSKQ